MGDMFKGTEGAQAAQKMQADSGDQLPGWMTRPTQAGQAYFGSRALAQPQPPTAGPLQEAAQPSAPLMTNALASIDNSAAPNAPASPVITQPGVPSSPLEEVPEEDQEMPYTDGPDFEPKPAVQISKEQERLNRKQAGLAKMKTMQQIGGASPRGDKPLQDRLKRDAAEKAEMEKDVQIGNENFAYTQKLYNDLEGAGVDLSSLDSFLDDKGKLIRDDRAMDAVNKLADANARNIAVSKSKKRVPKLASNDLSGVFNEELDDNQAQAIEAVFNSIGATPS